MNNCPCCSNQMLRHTRNSQIYWYCLHCKQEMPDLIDRIKKRTILNSSIKTHLHQEKTVMNLLDVA